MTENPATTFLFNEEMGQNAHFPDDTPPTIPTLTTNATHIQICRTSSGWEHRIVVFRGISERIHDETRLVTDGEHATMFDLERIADVSDPELAELQGADATLPERFARKGNRLNVLYRDLTRISEEHPQGYPAYSSFLLRESELKKLRNLRQHGSINGLVAI